MMKKILFIFFIGISVLGAGCKKFLETTPEDFVTPETYFTKESDAVAALNAAMNVMTERYFYAGYYQARMLAADDVYSTLTSVQPATLNITATEAVQIPSRWNNLYQAIQYTNIVLANLPRIEMDETRKGEIRGEALFLRAYFYFVLASEWGAVPLKLVPTASPNDISYPRTPVKEVFEQVLKDMTEAEALVPTTANALHGGAGYPAKTTVQGILARVCLKMAGFPLNDASKFQEAKKWAQKVVDSKEHKLNADYTQVFINYAAQLYDKEESMWEVDLNDVPGLPGGFGYLGYLDGLFGGAPSFGNSTGQVRVTRKLYELYGATSKDTRRDWNCAPFQYKDNTTTTNTDKDKIYYTPQQIYDRPSAKFRREYVPGPQIVNRSPINFPLLRYSDVLLMLAEADNEVSAGPSALAYTLVDQVRARAYGKLKAGATNLTEANVPRTYNKDSFRKLIQDERCREFAGEAIRKHDLIRWGIYVQTIKDLQTDVTDPTKPAVLATWRRQIQNLSTRVSERDLLWPIPATELTFNKLATQNPGW